MLKDSRFAILQNDRTQNPLLNVVEFKIISKVYKNVKIDIQSAIKIFDSKLCLVFIILSNTLDGFPRARRIDILDNLRQTRLPDSKIKCKKSGDL